MLGMLGCWYLRVKCSDMPDAGGDKLVSWLPDPASKAILPVQNLWHVYLEISFSISSLRRDILGKQSLYIFYTVNETQII